MIISDFAIDINNIVLRDPSSTIIILFQVREYMFMIISDFAIDINNIVPRDPSTGSLSRCTIIILSQVREYMFMIISDFAINISNIIVLRDLPPQARVCQCEYYTCSTITTQADIPHGNTVRTSSSIIIFLVRELCLMIIRAFDIFSDVRFVAPIVWGRPIRVREFYIFNHHLRLFV
jgi:hypothetical protein